MKKRILPPPDARPPLPDFTPVPREKCRHDGWTPERQRAFIAALAETGSVTVAARMVNMSWNSAYQLRNHPHAGEFRRAWEAAQGLGVQRLKDEAFDRALNGQLVPVFSNGKLMGYRRQKNDRLLMFYLDRFGQDAGGRTVTINRFEARAHASAAASGSGEAKAAAVAVVEQSTEARTGEPSDGIAIPRRRTRGGHRQFRRGRARYPGSGGHPARARRVRGARPCPDGTGESRRLLRDGPGGPVERV